MNNVYFILKEGGLTKKNVSLISNKSPVCIRYPFEPDQFKYTCLILYPDLESSRTFISRYFLSDNSSFDLYVSQTGINFSYLIPFCAVYIPEGIIGKKISTCSQIHLF